MRHRIGVVGGGASGLMAAIIAAEQGAEVTLLEGNDRPGKKILSTGNGKCNIGNRLLVPEAYYTESPHFLKSCLDRFGTEAAVSFFERIGLMIKSKNGYLYPVCEQAAAVLDVLRYRAASLGIKVVTGCRIVKIERADRAKEKTELIEKTEFIVSGQDMKFRFERLILACVGRAAPRTGSDGSGFLLAERMGHRILPTVPALVQLRCGEDYFKSVAGVRAEAEVTVLYGGREAAREQGELLLTDYGISGIPVFQISRVVNYLLLERDGAPHKRNGKSPETKKEVEAAVDFFPGCSREYFSRFHSQRMKELGDSTAEAFFTGILHKKLMMLFIRLAGLKPGERIDGADGRKIQKVYELCRNWKVRIVGSNSYDNAQVCAGGVPLDEVTENLESKKAKGLYFAGEILDVDGKCGGYNLHWAWCSGYLAGMAAAGREEESHQ